MGRDRKRIGGHMSYLQQKVKLAQLFDKTTTLPATPEECRSWFIGLAGDLSPENLSCDGELSRHQMRTKACQIKQAWTELEAIFGRKVTLDEAENWMIEDYRRERAKRKA